MLTPEQKMKCEAIHAAASKLARECIELKGRAYTVAETADCALHAEMMDILTVTESRWQGLKSVVLSIEKQMDKLREAMRLDVGETQLQLNAD